MTEELAQSTLNLLRNRSAQLMLKQVAAETSISYEWLKKFHQGYYLKHPPEHDKVIKKIEQLNKYLVSKLASPSA